MTGRKYLIEFILITLSVIAGIFSLEENSLILKVISAITGLAALILILTDLHIHIQRKLRIGLNGFLFLALLATAAITLGYSFPKTIPVLPGLTLVVLALALMVWANNRKKDKK